MSKYKLMRTKLTPILPLLLFISSLCFASDMDRYTHVIYNTIELSTYEYTNNIELDFFSAKGDDEKNKPLIIVMHGGGFQGGERMASADLKFCREMARRGFAVASISYRLTRTGKGFDCNTSYEEKMETFREASKDLLLATNYLLDNSKKLKFDPKKIILLGSSAGAEVVLNTVYLRGSEMQKGIDYGKAIFAGVVSIAGAMVDMTEFNKNAIPTVMIHGEKDQSVPYGKASHHFCNKDAPGYLILYGAEPITNRLQETGVSYLLLHDPEGNHAWAGWGYRFTQEIADFIKQAIIEDKTVQTKRIISA